MALVQHFWLLCGLHRNTRQNERSMQQPFGPVKPSIQGESTRCGALRSVLILCLVYQAACMDWKIHCTLTFFAFPSEACVWPAWQSEVQLPIFCLLSLLNTETILMVLLMMFGYLFAYSVFCLFVCLFACLHACWFCPVGAVTGWISDDRADKASCSSKYSTENYFIFKKNFHGYLC